MMLYLNLFLIRIALFFFESHILLQDRAFGIAKYLIEKGANLSIRGDSGETALDNVVEVGAFFFFFFFLEF